jgi:hypothetical protein
VGCTGGIVRVGGVAALGTKRRGWCVFREVLHFVAVWVEQLFLGSGCRRSEVKRGGLLRFFSFGMTAVHAFLFLPFVWKNWALIIGESCILREAFCDSDLHAQNGAAMEIFGCVCCLTSVVV